MILLEIFVFSSPLSFSTAPSSPHSPADDPPDRGFFIRMKSTLTKRGLHVKSSGYKVESLIEFRKHAFHQSFFPPANLLGPGRIQSRAHPCHLFCAVWVSQHCQVSHLYCFFIALTLFHSGPLQFNATHRCKTSSSPFFRSSSDFIL